MFLCVKYVNTAQRNSMKNKNCKEKMKENGDELIKFTKIF